MFKRLIKYLPIIAIIELGTLFKSCDFLSIDQYITDMFNLDTVFQKKEYSLNYLYDIYSYLDDGGTFDSNPYIGVADECVTAYYRDTHFASIFSNNNWSAEKAEMNRANKWKRFYEGIRKANTFINRIGECIELNPIEIRERTAEAQFLKAYFYFELMCMYGPVVILSDSEFDLDKPMNEILLPRNSWEECVEYVEKTLRKSIEGLPQTREAFDTGKPTIASALAILSRLKLYDASPLFNGNVEFSNFINHNTGKPYFNSEYKEEKWAQAAAVAKELVLLKPNSLYTAPKRKDTPAFPHEYQADFPEGVGGIDPYHSYKDIFDGEVMASANKEILFSRYDSRLWTGEWSWIRYMLPKCLDGLCSYSVTQSLIDAYYLLDGRSIDNASEDYPYLLSGYTDKDTIFSGYRLKSGVRNWYVNREMRFYATIGFNGCWYEGISTSKSSKKNMQISLYYDGNSGKILTLRGDDDKDDYNVTGYLMKKYLHYEDSWSENGTVRPKHWIYYRMAEVYLNYVEAMNELTQSYTIGKVTVSRDQAEMKRYFNMIRFRAGLPGITDSDVADVEKMRKLIERERQIEFAWEGRRYFDVRRNKTASYYENLPVLGCNINAMTVDKEAYYVVSEVRENEHTRKVFTKRQYFWPIPKYEVDKNPQLDQNPGWY